MARRTREPQYKPILGKFEEKGTESRASCQKGDNDPVHHRCSTTGASILRKPYTSKPASMRALDGSATGRTVA